MPNLITTAPKVKTLLEENPECRDNDLLLMSLIWKWETKSIGLTNFLFEFKNGSLTHPETITRCRRKLQEKYPHLRGHLWNKRHNIQSDVCDQLKQM